MLALLQALSWPELRLHPWRNATALLAVVLGVALAFSVQLINESALSEFGSAVRSINGEADFELRSAYRGAAGGFDEQLYSRVAAHPQVAIASPVVELDTVALAANGRRVALRVLGLDMLVAARLAPGLLSRPFDDAERLAVLDPDAVFLNPAAQQALGLAPQSAPGRPKPTELPLGGATPQASWGPNQSSSTRKSCLTAEQLGQVQCAGRSAKGVPGGICQTSSPSAGS